MARRRPAGRRAGARPRGRPQPVRDEVESAAEEVVVEEFSKTKKQASLCSVDAATLGGCLTREEADARWTTPRAEDRALFAQSLVRAARQHRGLLVRAGDGDDDDEWRRFSAALHASAPISASRPRKSAATLLRLDAYVPAHDAKCPRVGVLHFGAGTRLRPWFCAPLPAELFGLEDAAAPLRGSLSEADIARPPAYVLPPGVVGVSALWMCAYCLRFFRSGGTRDAHVAARCRLRPPPGCEVWRSACGRLSVFEVDGRLSRAFCQRLALLARMFLDHKAVCWDVEPFLFYVLVEWAPAEAAAPPERELDADERVRPASWSLAAYFSKEKDSPAHYNLSCIATLPHHQRKGYGALLIDFSYVLTRVQRAACIGGGRVADTPERPLSDLGLAAYVRYWSAAVARAVVARADAAAAAHAAATEFPAEDHLVAPPGRQRQTTLREFFRIGGTPAAAVRTSPRKAGAPKAVPGDDPPSEETRPPRIPVRLKISAREESSIEPEAPKSAPPDAEDVFVTGPKKAPLSPPAHPSTPYPGITVALLAEETGMASEDVVATLEHLGLVREVAHPAGGGGRGARVVVDPPAMARLRALAAAPFPRADPAHLRWVPFTLKR